MKPLLVFVMIFSASAAFADSFRLVKDGRDYLCSSTSPTTPGGAVECVDKAYSGPFTKEESIRLCQGANSVAPAECALKAYSGPFTKDESIRLCTGARSVEPVECVNKAYSGAFSKSESVELCNGDSTVANAECAIKAYSGPYSKAESIRLCKANPQLMLRSLNLMQQSPEIQQKVMQLKVNYPALRE